MIEKIVRLPGTDTPCEDVLGAAKKADLDTLLLVGKNQDGSLYFACTTSDGGEAMLLISRAEHQLNRLIAEQFGDL